MFLMFVRMKLGWELIAASHASYANAVPIYSSVTVGVLPKLVKCASTFTRLFNLSEITRHSKKLKKVKTMHRSTSLMRYFDIVCLFLCSWDKQIPALSTFKTSLSLSTS